MDDSTSAALTEITVRIPADLARRLGTGGEVERRVLEALALDEFRQGHLGRAELRRLLGFATRAKLDEFLTVSPITHHAPLLRSAPDEGHHAARLLHQSTRSLSPTRQ